MQGSHSNVICRFGHLRRELRGQVAAHGARTVREMIPKSVLFYRGSRMRGTLLAAAAVALVAGCSTYDNVTQRIAQSITPYRITVVQGNTDSERYESITGHQKWRVLP